MALAGIIIGWISAGLGIGFIVLVVVFFAWAVTVTPTDPSFNDTIGQNLSAVTG
jgi:hypothetical protein